MRSKTLINEIITQPFHNHVALPGSHWLIIDADDQGLIGLFNSNTSRSLKFK